MTRLFATVLLLVVSTAAVAAPPAGPASNSSSKSKYAPRSKSGSQATERPNIVFMLSDDQGWSGLSVNMHPDNPASKGEIFHTPNLEKFAAQGMRFSAGYSPAPVCSPTRISLQTGKSPAQLHWTKAAPPEMGHLLLEPQLIKNIGSDQVTIGELLRSAGYATAHYGKWHIAGGGPGAHGYDEHDGDTGNENAYQFVDPNPVDIFGMAERAANFMERNSKAHRPFYVQLSWNALHAPENALRATQAKYANLSNARNPKQAATAAITEDLDTGVGRVLDSIERLGLADNTYVIYMSDNGAGGGGRGGLRGGKGGVWEGGIRVPLIIRGPGVRPNSWCHVPVVGYDFLPTFCEWAGIPTRSLPKGIEGGSIASLLTHDGQGKVVRPREELIFHFPHYQSDDGPQSAIILGNLKLMKFYETDSVALFDLSRDLSEQNDLASQMPSETAQLRKRLESYLAAVDAQLPSPNPQYDPSRPVVTQRGGGGGGMGGKGGGKGGRFGMQPGMQGGMQPNSQGGFQPGMQPGGRGGKGGKGGMQQGMPGGQQGMQGGQQGMQPGMQGGQAMQGAQQGPMQPGMQGGQQRGPGGKKKQQQQQQMNPNFPNNPPNMP